MPFSLLWGGQSCPQPPFRRLLRGATVRRLKAGGGQNWLPHNVCQALLTRPRGALALRHELLKLRRRHGRGDLHGTALRADGQPLRQGRERGVPVPLARLHLGHVRQELQCGGHLRGILCGIGL